MAVAPAKVQSITTDYANVGDLNIVGNRAGFQGPLSRPLVHALGAGTIARAAITPGDTQFSIAFLTNLAGLDGLAWLCGFDFHSTKNMLQTPRFCKLNRSFISS